MSCRGELLDRQTAFCCACDNLMTCIIGLPKKRLHTFTEVKVQTFTFCLQMIFTAQLTDVPIIYHM